MRIGLTGRNAAGKGAVAEYLVERGFAYHSLSDVIREELAKRGLEPTRERMIACGRELRAREGLGVLARRILERIDDGLNTVIDSIRHPAEVEVLRAAGDFVLLEVTAPDEVRFARMRARARPGDPEDLETFRAMEARELAPEASEGQQLVATAALADYHVANDGTLEDLHAALDRLVPDILRRRTRPDWDDYFMGIAHQVAMRSNCLKRRVGAVIALERRIVSTGYNGTPRGARNCNEGGCPRCNSMARSGEGLEACFCSHAEENAITQAAYHGTRVAGGTIYVTLSPCLMCTKMLINAGIREVVYNADYALGETTRRLFEECGVRVRQHALPRPR